MDVARLGTWYAEQGGFVERSLEDCIERGEHDHDQGHPGDRGHHGHDHEGAHSRGRRERHEDDGRYDRDESE